MNAKHEGHGGTVLVINLLQVFMPRGNAFMVHWSYWFLQTVQRNRPNQLNEPYDVSRDRWEESALLFCQSFMCSPKFFSCFLSMGKGCKTLANWGLMIALNCLVKHMTLLLINRLLLWRILRDIANSHYFTNIITPLSVVSSYRTV